MKITKNKMKVNFKNLITLLLLIFTSYSSASLEKQNLNLNNQRKLFLQTEKELLKGNRNLLTKNQNELKKYVLYPYLLYQDLYNRIDNVSKNEIILFTNKYNDSTLSNNIKIKWLYTQVENDNWDNFSSLYSPTLKNLTLKCYYLNTKLKEINNKKIKTLKEINNIWLNNNYHPKSCNTLFQTWKNKGYMKSNIVFKKINSEIIKNNYQKAKSLEKHLNKDDQVLLSCWLNTIKNPKFIHRLYLHYKNHPFIAKIINNVIIKIAKKNPKVALQLWKKYNARLHFKKEDWDLFSKEMAFILAEKGHKKAKEWLNKIPIKYQNENFFDLRLKFALLKNDWPYLLNITNALPIKLQNKPKWKYWKARALDKNGYTELSKKILNNLSTKKNYYGFLANIRLFKPYSFSNKTFSLTKSEIEDVLKIKGILRAIELYKLNKFYQANYEWFYATKKMNETQKQAAAKIGAKLKIPNWSIVALAKANHQDNFKLRFPLYYRKIITKEAKNNKIDPAWIFAITRQESAFIKNARSKAGALGLMQIIPKTGRMLAKSENLKLNSIKDLYEPAKNIKLGSKYLKMMLEKYNDNQVLATAAYNAGPNKVLSWLPKNKIDADSWIETIPYKETKNYVQNVLTYTVIYQMLLGKKPSLEIKNLKI